MSKKNKDRSRIPLGRAGYPRMHEMFVPKAIFFTNGVGDHKDRLSSFELALRDAGIEKANLVTVSSIFPPHCKEISRKEGEKLIMPGQIVHCVMARQDTNEPNRLIAASIGLARPADKDEYGYLSEHHSYGETAKKAGDYAEDLAATMLATTLGIEFDAEKAWSEREQVFQHGEAHPEDAQRRAERRGQPEGRVVDGRRAAASSSSDSGPSGLPGGQRENRPAGCNSRPRSAMVRA